MKKDWIYFFGKLAVSVALLWLIAVNFDMGGSASMLSGLDLGWLAGALLVFALSIINNALRWGVVMAAIKARLPAWITFRILYIGLFFNEILPSSVGGDAARIYLGRRHGQSLQGAINGVMLDRVVNVFGLIILVVAMQPFLLARIGDNPAKYVFPALAVIAVAGVIFLMLLDRIPERFTRWSIVRVLVNLAADTKLLFLQPIYALLAVGFGISSTALVSLIVYFLALALGIAGVGVIDFLVLIPPVMLIAAVPISIAGWGLRESAMVAAFGFIGVAEGDAFVLSLLFGIANVLTTLPGGLIWLFSGERRKGQAIEAPETAGDEGGN
jgi:uncharacterized protein (TIRG00374 family)